MIISRLFPSNIEFSTCLLLAFSVLIFDIFTSHFINPIPSFLTFRSKPTLSDDGKNISFKLHFSPSNLNFVMKSDFSSVDIPISPFCNNKVCSIPLITGGDQQIIIRSQTHTLFTKKLHLNDLSIECKGKNRTYRFCQLRNACYHKLP